LVQLPTNTWCLGVDEVPLSDDTGLLASQDPVAIDQASVDLVNKEEGNRSSKLPKNWEPEGDKFRAIYPEVDWNVQLAYAEEIGMGTREYELIRI
jgi:hypothetical protein